MNEQTPPRWPLLLTIAFILAVLLLLGWQAVLTISDTTQFPDGIQRRDILAFFTAATLGWQGESSPYIYAHYASFSAEAGYDIAPFIYPPLTLPLLLPLAAFTLDDVFIASLSINIVAGTAAYALLAHWLARWSGGLWAKLAVLLLAASNVTYGNLWWGQVNFIALLGIMLMLMGLGRRFPHYVGGLGLGLAMACKIHFAPLLLFLWWRGERRTALWALGLLAFLAALSLLLFPAGWWHDWLFITLPQGQFGTSPTGLNLSPVAVIGNYNWNGVISRLLTENAFYTPLLVRPQWVPWLGYAGAMAFMGSALLWAGGRKNVPIEQGCGLMLMAIFLSAPLSWEKHLIFLFPFVLWLLAGYGQQRQWGRFWLVAGSMTFMLSDYVYYNTYALLFAVWGAHEKGLYLAFGCVPFALLLLIYILLFRPPLPQPQAAGK